MFSLFPWLAEKLGFSAEFVEHYLHVITSGVVAPIITILSVIVWRKLRNTEANLIPEKRPSLVGIIAFAAEGILGLMRSIMGERADRYFPLIGSLFLYILISNLLGAIPGMVPPTDNINTNFACAAVVFVYYNVMGIREQGFKNYFKHLAGPIIWLAPLIFTIELISHLVRPASLSIRLFGNITGDHLVLEMFSTLVPVGIPVIFLGLTVFVALIQAFVFTLLSTVYIALATEHAEHH